MTQHTPGPWIARLEGKLANDIIQIEGDGRTIVQVWDFPEVIHNAHLIAAAPELLEACYKVLASYKTDDLESYAIPAIEQAIAKTKGET